MADFTTWERGTLEAFAREATERMLRDAKKIECLDSIASARQAEINSAGDALNDAGYTDEDAPLWQDIRALTAQRDKALEALENLRGDMRKLADHADRLTPADVRAFVDGAIAASKVT